MGKLGTRILVLAWAVFWYGVFLPGHQRGQILLPGADPAQGCECCSPAVKPVAACPACERTPGKAVPARRAGECAVCLQMHHLEAPTTINLTLPEIGLLGILPVPPVTALQGVRFIAIVQERGPPAPFSI